MYGWRGADMTEEKEGPVTQRERERERERRERGEREREREREERERCLLVGWLLNVPATG